MARRRAHLVGSLPGASASEAMGFAVERLGNDLGYLPDGETGDRRNWIMSAVEGFRDNPALELKVDGDWSGYRRTPRFRVRRGERLYGASLDLGIGGGCCFLPAAGRTAAGRHPARRRLCP